MLHAADQRPGNLQIYATWSYHNAVLHRSHPQASDHCDKAVGILIRCLCWRCKKLGHYNLQSRRNPPWVDCSSYCCFNLVVYHWLIQSLVATLGWPEDCERDMLPHKESNMVSRFPVGPIFFQSWPTLEHMAEADSQCSTIVLHHAWSMGLIPVYTAK